MSILLEYEEKMQKTIEHFFQDMKSVRTSRANISLLDNIRVDYYGERTLLNQIAVLNTPNANTITIEPWDKSMIKAIEKSIQESDLALNPSNDGILIRLNIPPLTEERRKDILKIARKRVEEAKIAIRNIRRDANEHLKKLEKEGELNEDDSKKYHNHSQKLTDTFITKIDDAYSQKEKDVLEF